MKTLLSRAKVEKISAGFAAAAEFFDDGNITEEVLAFGHFLLDIFSQIV
jgi:hypothetical protein